MDQTTVSHELLLDHLQDGVCFVDQQSIITYWNRGAERITGFRRQEMIGRECEKDLLAHSDRDGTPVFATQSPIMRCLGNGTTFDEEVFIRHAEGHRVPVYSRVSPILNSRDEVIGALEVFSDNSSRLQALERIEELEQLALLCPLTGMGNRRYTQMALENACQELRRYDWSFGILFIDIDHFKQINDTYGHGVGDQILVMVASALRSGLRSFDFVGRWGGEEFIVLLPNVTDDVLRRVAERCQQLVRESVYQHEGKSIQVTVSMGGVLAERNDTASECVERADRLMYKSKAGGRDRITLG